MLRAVWGRRLTLGDKHPDTLESWNSLIGLYEAWGKLEKLKSGEQNCRKKKLWMSDITDSKSPLPETEKHRSYRVTL